METSRRAQQQAELRADIIRVAQAQLDAGGAAAVTWRAIAREVGVGASTLYTYFDGIDALFTALLVDAYGALAEAVRTAVQRAGADPQKQLAAGLRAYRAWAVANPSRYNLIFTDVLPGYAAPPEGPTVDAQVQALAPIAQAAAALLGRRDPDLRTWPAADRHRALGIWAQIHGLTMLEINHHLQWAGGVDDLFDALVTQAVAAISGAVPRSAGR